MQNLVFVQETGLDVDGSEDFACLEDPGSMCRIHTGIDLILRVLHYTQTRSYTKGSSLYTD